MKKIHPYITFSNVVLVLLGLFILLSLLFRGIYASFNDAKSNPGNTMSSANLKINVTPSVGTVVFNVSSLVPGDTVSRDVAVQNIGNVDFTYTISASSTSPTLLWTNSINGLQLKVSNIGTGTIYYDGPIAGLSTSNIALTSASTQNVRFLATFPTSADNTFQNLSENITFTFNATQVAGSSK